LPQSDRSILHIAALEGHYDLVVALCMRGVDVNSKDSAGMTPLHEAAWHGHSEICKVLMSKGMDPDATNDVRPPHPTTSPLPCHSRDAMRYPHRLHVLVTISLPLSEPHRCSLDGGFSPTHARTKTRKRRRRGAGGQHAAALRGGERPPGDGEGVAGQGRGPDAAGQVAAIAHGSGGQQ